MDQTRLDPDDPNAITLTFGHEQLVIHRRYEVLSILNDFMLGLWFLIGSILFFYPSEQNTGVWLFTIGSAQLLIRPVIRLSRHIHLRRLPGGQWSF
ncbi:MAG: YrhK family protein [Gammaproteobacteria bacterium]|jgi:hypothetical protein